MMSTDALGGPLLRSVSRSFYLSIRILPAAIRAPIGLAYLLARTSDTIADSADAPAETRLKHLAAFQQMAATRRRDATDVATLQQEIRPADPAEQRLLEQLPGCLDWLAAIDAPARAEVISVLEKIIHGQSLDIQRFPAAHAGSKITALQTAAELDEYTYLVAGCVGEFWTRVCLLRLPESSRLPAEELRRIGANFGKGLQLVNILRDLPADLRAGRCYLPAEELRAAGVSPGELLERPAAAQAIFEAWREKGLALLEDGRRYICSIRGARLRAACYLPWTLGVQTLDLIGASYPLTSPVRIKVPRSAVRRALLHAPLAAFFDGAL